MIGRLSRLCQALSGPVACHYGANNSCPQAAEDTGRPGPANRPWQVSLECWHRTAKLLTLIHSLTSSGEEKSCGLVPFLSSPPMLSILSFRFSCSLFFFVLSPPLSFSSYLCLPLFFMFSFSIILYLVYILSFLIFVRTSCSNICYHYYYFHLSIYLSLSQCSPLCSELWIWLQGTCSPLNSLP